MEEESSAVFAQKVRAKMSDLDGFTAQRQAEPWRDRIITNRAPGLRPGLTDRRGRGPVSACPGPLRARWLRHDWDQRHRGNPPRDERARGKERRAGRV